LSVVALSSPPPTSSKKSITSSARTTQIRCPLYGLPQPTRSSRKSRDFVSEFPGQNTSKFKLTYSLPVNLGRQLTGRYSGTLNQVLARILDRNDYIVEVSDDAIKVVISGGMVASVRAVVAPAGSPGEARPLLPQARPPPNSLPGQSRGHQFHRWPHI